jgi:hypothetical protein
VRKSLALLFVGVFSIPLYLGLSYVLERFFYIRVSALAPFEPLQLILALASVTIVSALVLYASFVQRVLREEPQEEGKENEGMDMNANETERYGAFPFEERSEDETFKPTAKPNPQPLNLSLADIENPPPPKNRRDEGELERLLAQVIRAYLTKGSLASSITLSNRGRYKVLGRTWRGEISLNLRPAEEDRKPQEARKGAQEPEIEKPF